MSIHLKCVKQLNEQDYCKPMKCPGKQFVPENTLEHNLALKILTPVWPLIRLQIQ